MISLKIQFKVKAKGLLSVQITINVMISQLNYQVTANCIVLQIYLSQISINIMNISLQKKRINALSWFYICNSIIYLIFISMQQKPDLLPNQLKKPSQSPQRHPKSKDRRPPQISVSKIFSGNHKWKQCKIIGKNISIRSYSAACSFQNKLYLYGGYQILNGSLNDFYRISLDESEPTFLWEDLIAKSKVNPGSRSKHALLGGKTRIYLIGGLKANNQASNDIFQFDPKTHEWTLLHPSGAKLPPIQSFSSVIISKEVEERIIIAFGFNQDTASPSNTVYEYNINKNKLSILFEGSQKGKNDAPSPRIGSAIATDNENVYIFGGKEEANRLNDLWSFSLSDYKFQRLKDEGEIPAVRNGHTMNYSQGKLYVFGGIHDITWQLDDLHIFTIKSNQWRTLQQDSPRKIEKKAYNSEAHNEEKSEKGSKKKNFYENQSANFIRNNPSSPLRNYSVLYNEDALNKAESPGKMLNEQRKKVFFQKKAEMLSNFQITKEQKQKLVALQTPSQAMKNSLDVIGNPGSKTKIQEDRLTDFGKESFSKFLSPLENNSNIVIGKKPCARDGHCTVMLGSDMIILGGDRHQMSFNDIYKLNLDIALNGLK